MWVKRSSSSAHLNCLLFILVGDGCIIVFMHSRLLFRFAAGQWRACSCLILTAQASEFLWNASKLLFTTVTRASTYWLVVVYNCYQSQHILTRCNVWNFYNKSLHDPLSSASVSVLMICSVLCNCQGIYYSIHLDCFRIHRILIQNMLHLISIEWAQHDYFSGINDQFVDQETWDTALSFFQHNRQLGV
jgi:hypothetical protein